MGLFICRPLRVAEAANSGLRPVHWPGHCGWPKWVAIACGHSGWPFRVAIAGSSFFGNLGIYATLLQSYSIASSSPLNRMLESGNLTNSIKPNLNASVCRQEMNQTYFLYVPGNSNFRKSWRHFWLHFRNWTWNWTRHDILCVPRNSNLPPEHFLGFCFRFWSLVL